MKNWFTITLLVSLLAVLLFAQQPQGPPSPEQMAKLQAVTQADHQRTMQMLGIKELRRGADGRNMDAPNAVNYDEAKVLPYPPLPDPLVLKNGKRVTSAKMWWSQRRAEIVEEFDREVYGSAPKVTPKVRWEVVSTTNEVKYDVPVITKQLLGHVDNSSYPAVTVDIRLTLTTPANVKGGVPVMMEYGFGPLPPRPPNAATTAPPIAPPGMPWQQQVLNKG